MSWFSATQMNLRTVKFTDHISPIIKKNLESSVGGSRPLYRSQNLQRLTFRNGYQIHPNLGTASRLMDVLHVETSLDFSKSLQKVTH